MDNNNTKKNTQHLPINNNWTKKMEKKPILYICKTLVKYKHTLLFNKEHILKSLVNEVWNDEGLSSQRDKKQRNL